MTTAITLQTQHEVLKLDVAQNVEQIFDSMPELTTNCAMRDALVGQAKEITVFQRDNTGKIIIADSDAYIAATEQVQALKSVAEDICEILDPYADRLFKLHRAVTGYRAKVLAPIEAEQKRLKQEREQFAAEEERKRREAAAKAQQEAYEREQARLLEESSLAAATGNYEAAEEILQEALNVEVAPVVLPSTTPQVQGTNFRTAWEWKLNDFTKLKPEFVKVDEVAIGKIVRSMHKSAEKLVGDGAITVWDKQIIVDR
jgi:hypothetical protein